jgi:hypothetical protein
VAIHAIDILTLSFTLTLAAPISLAPELLGQQRIDYRPVIGSAECSEFVTGAQEVSL